MRFDFIEISCIVVLCGFFVLVAGSIVNFAVHLTAGY